MHLMPDTADASSCHIIVIIFSNYYLQQVQQVLYQEITFCKSFSTETPDHFNNYIKL